MKFICKNSLYCIFDQINAALMSRRDFFQKQPQSLQISVYFWCHGNPSWFLSSSQTSVSLLSLSDTLVAVLERDTLGVREVHLFVAAVRWAEAEAHRQQLQSTPENKRRVLGKALNLIRFPLMTIEEFAAGLYTCLAYGINPAKPEILNNSQNFFWGGTVYWTFRQNIILIHEAFIALMWPWTTKAVISSTGIFVAIANNTLYGSKLSIFLLCQKLLGY